MKKLILMLICIAAIIVQTITKDYLIVVCILYFYVLIDSLWGLLKKGEKWHGSLFFGVGKYGTKVADRVSSGNFSIKQYFPKDIVHYG